MKPVNKWPHSKMTMTISELIDALSKYPADMPVIATLENVAAGIRVENFDVNDRGEDEPQLCIDVENYG